MSLSEKINAHRVGLGGAHRAGTFHPGPLDKIETVLAKYFPDQELVTAETGCGASTILFQHYAQRHYAYTYDDREFEKSSVHFAQSFPGFRNDRVVWNFGPTQKTLPHNAPKEKLDVVLIDGPHGYPFPDLEYFFFYPLLKPNGVLIIDDINIPSIDNMFRLLCEDDMFYLDSVVMSTAFLRRSGNRTFDPTGDGWWEQRYNLQRYPLPNPFWGPPLDMPLNWSFNGSNVFPNPYLVRGFTPKEGMPATEGPLSLIWLPFRDKTSGVFEVEVEFEPLLTEARAGAGIEMYLQYGEKIETDFKGPGVVTLKGRATLKDQYHLEIKFHHKGTRWQQEIAAVSPGMVDFRMFNGVLRRLTVREVETKVLPPPVSHMTGSVARGGMAGAEACFFVASPRDPVQASHYQGRYHYATELEALKAHVPAGATVLDIGSSLGEHALYFAKTCEARKVVVVEAHPVACEVIRLNKRLNGAEAIDTSSLGKAVSDQTGRAAVTLPHPDYISAGSITAAEKGDIEMCRSDAIAPAENFDVIRIDIGAATAAVLRGLMGHLRKTSPTLLVTVPEDEEKRALAALRTLGFGAAERVGAGPRLTLVCKKIGAKK
jgi:FkbM family methyltransferase